MGAAAACARPVGPPARSRHVGGGSPHLYMLASSCFCPLFPLPRPAVVQPARRWWRSTPLAWRCATAPRSCTPRPSRWGPARNRRLPFSCCGALLLLWACWRVRLVHASPLEALLLPCLAAFGLRRLGAWARSRAPQGWGTRRRPPLCPPPHPPPDLPLLCPLIPCPAGALQPKVPGAAGAVWGRGADDGCGWAATRGCVVGLEHAGCSWQGPLGCPPWRPPRGPARACISPHALPPNLQTPTANL